MARLGACPNLAGYSRRRDSLETEAPVMSANESATLASAPRPAAGATRLASVQLVEYLERRVRDARDAVRHARTDVQH